MQKILYVHYGNSWMRGSEICLLNLMRSLDSRQYCPILWTNNPKLHKAAQQHSIHSHLSEFGVLFGWKDQRASLVQFSRQISQAKKLIQENNISIVHVNSAAPCQWMWYAARQCGVPLLTQLHSRYNLRDRLRLCLHLSPHIVAVSKAVSEQMLSEGYPQNQLSVIYNGLDIPTLESQPTRMVRSTLGLPIDSTVIASVGSLIQRKGMDRIINALATLSPTRSELHLLLIGDGPELPKLRKLVHQLKVTDKVHFVGEQHHVCGWLRGGVDLFVSGAREEAFGLVLAEAAIAGVPVVAPSVGGIPEVLQHNESALLYASNQQEQMVNHIQTLLNNRSFADTLSRNARKRVCNLFSLKANTDNLSHLYTELVNQYICAPPLPKLVSSIRPLRTLSCSHLIP